MMNRVWPALLLALVIVIPTFPAEATQESDVHGSGAPKDTRGILVVVVLDEQQQKDLSDASTDT
jgi:hypothetical protein